MKIKIKKDEHNYVDQMFSDTMKTYNYLKTDILLYLLYGENIKWKYFEDEDSFFISRGSDLVEELSKNEWKKMFVDYCVSIDKSRTAISIRTEDEDFQKKFICLLDELKIEYKIRNDNMLNKILGGKQDEEI